MTATGWVDKTQWAADIWGIQGSWYWRSDATSGGKTVINNPQPGVMPVTPERGMCIQGTTPGGGADNYVTWGAAIGIYLNQIPGSPATPVLPTAPPCYVISVSAGSVLGGMRAKLVADPNLAGHEPPGMDLVQGANQVCVTTVDVPVWCAPDRPIACDDPSTLANGIAAVEVQLNAGANGGVIDFCVNGIAPQDS